MTEDRDYHNQDCRNLLPLAILFTLFYALPRLAWDSWRDRRGAR
jgi:hypothetical protein